MKPSCAENVTGLKPCTEAAGSRGQNTDVRGQRRTKRCGVVRGPSGLPARLPRVAPAASGEPDLAADRAARVGRSGAASEQIDLREHRRGVCEAAALEGRVPPL